MPSLHARSSSAQFCNLPTLGLGAVKRPWKPRSGLVAFFLLAALAGAGAYLYHTNSTVKSHVNATRTALALHDVYDVQVLGCSGLTREGLRVRPCKDHADRLRQLWLHWRQEEDESDEASWRSCRHDTGGLVTSQSTALEDFSGILPPVHGAQRPVSQQVRLAAET